MHPQRSTPLLRKFLLALASAGLTLALAEGVAWLVLAGLGPEHAPLHLHWDEHQTTLRAQSLRDELYRPDPACFFRLKPDLDLSYTASGMIFDVRTNSLGLRGEELQDPRPVGGVRILCVGDSCTFGTGVGQHDTYPAVLETNLRRELSNQGVEILNAGVPGYTSYQCLRYLESEGFDLAPDVIVFCTNFNEASPATAGPKRPMAHDQVLTDRQYGAQLRPASRLALLRLARRWSGGAGRSPRPAGGGRRTRRVPLNDHREHLLRFLQACRERDILAVLVVWPLRAQAGSRQDYPDDRLRAVRPYQRTMVEVAREQGALLVDLRPVAQGQPQWFVDQVHMGPEGYAEVADAVARALGERLAR
ncbi:MAG: GDSL-type esterase/lipase family protein [Planctomycetota bacterium]